MESEKSYLCEEQHEHTGVVARVRAQMPGEGELYDMAELFKVFGDSTRVRILSALFYSELCVCDICSVLNMTKSAISHQLRILRQTKLVKSRREGKEVFYSLADGHIEKIFAMAKEHLEE
ncbi:MAG: helix-turn-helix transcriptional regulator [Clostridia bacterium]|nr:helix-turn-helix transcriptional regulator [Clostridia bacterium]